MNNAYSYDDKCLQEGRTYSIGTNDGKEFKQVVFIGWKLMNGKSIMTFTTTENQQLTVNPSFHTFTIEESMDNMDDTTLKSLGFNALVDDPINQALKPTLQDAEDAGEDIEYTEKETNHG
tara:strand:+ start:189 stop:548 length:360 start_codon:yes stop_codon:yes gene_type:complete